MTIICQIETRDGGYYKMVTDDGTMLESVGISRIQWLAQYAYKQKNIRPEDGLVHVEIDEFVETWLKPTMQSWWISEMSGLKVLGSYDIEFYVDDDGNTRYLLSNRNLDWLGWDRIDTNPEKEWNAKNYTLWFMESMVGVVGDSILGADFPVYVFAYEHKDEVYKGTIQ
jgi:hypothetical protein